METLHQLGQRQPHVIERLRAAIEWLQAIHQHNLAIETDKMLFIKVFDDGLAVIVETRTQHADVAVFIRLRQL
ncbi:hypothetical protein D3C78_1730600 [compost metagenome]